MITTVILTMLKWLGFFWLAKIITAKRPRILCYHGIAVDDEYLFSPGVFMRSSTFARRMAIINKWGYRPLSLNELYQQHQAGNFKKNALVITLDDGWAAIEQGMLPVLKKYNFIATLYLSTYFVIHQRPVFELSTHYLFWKYKGPFVLPDNSCLKPYTDKVKLNIDDLLQLATKLGSGYEQAILQELADYFGEDITQWQQSGKLMFLTPEKVTSLAKQRLAIELHTHRHKFYKLNSTEMAAEITDNQHYITKFTGIPAQHFCYPSGHHRTEQLQLLTDMNLITATTTQNRLISTQSNLLELPRLVDSDIISELEFEAELCGIMSLLRSANTFFKKGIRLS
jgi:peptidoglycan/xylan/chitin deacetylase (PgdA/CDA1 family)